MKTMEYTEYGKERIFRRCDPVHQDNEKSSQKNEVCSRDINNNIVVVVRVNESYS